MVSGDIFIPKWKNSVVWLDTASFVIVEAYLILLCGKLKEDAG